MSKFKAGDVVELKSGSPAMTVSNPNAVNGLVDCTWFQMDDMGYFVGGPFDGRFSPESLKLVEVNE